MSWLDDLKVGDKVVIRNERIGVVTGETKTMFIIVSNAREQRFWKKNAHLVGDVDKWHSTWIDAWTQEAEDRIRTEHERKTALYKISMVKWQNVPTETINQIIAILMAKQEEVNK